MCAVGVGAGGGGGERESCQTHFGHDHHANESIRYFVLLVLQMSHAETPYLHLSFCVKDFGKISTRKSSEKS